MQTQECLQFEQSGHFDVFSYFGDQIAGERAEESICGGLLSRILSDGHDTASRGQESGGGRVWDDHDDHDAD